MDKTTTSPLKIEIFEENKAGQDKKLKKIPRQLDVTAWDVIYGCSYELPI